MKDSIDSYIFFKKLLRAFGYLRVDNPVDLSLDLHFLLHDPCFVKN